MAKNIACFACASGHELPRQVVTCLLQLRRSYWEFMDDQGCTHGAHCPTHQHRVTEEDAPAAARNETRLIRVKADMPLLEAELAYWSEQ